MSCNPLVSLLAVATLLLQPAGLALGDVLVLTGEQAIYARDVRIDAAAGVTPLDENGEGPTLSLSDIMLIAFDPLPRAVQPRAWLCLRDGQRISGTSVTVGATGFTLQKEDGQALAARRDEVAAVFFSVPGPLPHVPPQSGVRIIAGNNDVLDVPAVEWTRNSLIVDIDPNIDPIVLPLERVAGVLWPSGEPPNAREQAGEPLVELRTGERLSGSIQALDGQTLTLLAERKLTIPRNELRALWFGGRRVRPVADLLPPASPAIERPRYRVNRSILGGPLRVGQRAYGGGIGLRGPATVELPVPAGARWLVADVGADAAAARFARITWEIAVDGQPRLRRENVAPGEPAERAAVPVAGAGRLVLRVEPAGSDPTGCLGVFANAMFIE